MLSKLKSKHPHLFTLSIMECLGYGTSLAALGYLTVFLQDIGMDDSQIGTITACGGHGGISFLGRRER